MHRKQLTHIFSLLLLFAACFLGGTLLARATASEAGESDNAGNETAGTANEAAGAASKTTGAASETAGTANEADASASKSWGLSYQEEGKRPQGTDTLEDLAAHGAYYARDTEEKVLYLTFDCGYENGHGSHHALIEERITPAEDHHFVLTEHLEPTCIELGLDTYTCDKCGETVSQYLTLTAHTWGEAVVYPQTCTEGGYTENICSYCGYTAYENATEATGHALSPNDEGYAQSMDKMELISSVPNVCGSGSVDTYQCTHINNGVRCDYTVVIGEPADHTLGDYVVTKEPTCTESGLQHRECQNEGCTYRTAEEEIPPLGHLPGESYIEKGSCTEDGAQKLDCTRCGANLEDYAIEARNHQWSEWKTVQAPTCTETGLQQRVCQHTEETEKYKACDAIETQPLPATDHDWGDWTTVTPATCEGDGLERRICKNDPSHVEENILPAIGHAWDEGVIE